MINSTKTHSTPQPIKVNPRRAKKRVIFSIVIVNVKLMQERSLEYFRMRIARMKQDKEIKDEGKKRRVNM